MSYQIIYDPKDIHKANKRRKHRYAKIAICILGIFIFEILRFTGWGNTIWQYLIPGDPVITTEAFQKLSDGLQSGQSLSDAVFVFCETVIQGANLG